MTDAVNILVHSENQYRKLKNKDSTFTLFSEDVSVVDGVVGAVWHLFPSQEVEALSMCVTQIATHKKVSIDHPIHDQWIYLPKNKLAKLSTTTINQEVGDAIFIPAGCAHQVCNVQDAIKIAIDFISPEHFQKTRDMTEQFRYLSKGHKRRVDLAQSKMVGYQAAKWLLQ